MRLPLDSYGVDLHVHLDGAIRPETLFEISNDQKSKVLFQNLEELKGKLMPRKPHSLKDFLKAFEIIIPLVAGKKEVLARICEEFVEDCVKRGGLCYVETRYCPFLLTDSKCTAEEVLKTILDALNRASKKHGIEVRSILSIMRHMPETAKETLELAKNYQPHGVVAIDIAGDDSVLKLQRVPEEIVQTFENAKKANIHRTVHVGENSPASSVYEAVNNLYAERIGHGYHILDDENAYKSLLETGVHFELNLMSGMGAVFGWFIYNGSHQKCIRMRAVTWNPKGNRKGLMPKHTHSREFEADIKIMDSNWKILLGTCEWKMLVYGLCSSVRGYK
ncbi:unnamed protein product [Schistosoma mattheei]|nr:unnamed protein product [Schistosoma mattheei]